MFGIGETEFVIIVIFAFLLFGPDKLPGMGRTLGRVLRQFREASEGFTEVVQTNIVDPATQELNNTGSARRTPAAARQTSVDDEDADIEPRSDEAGSEATPKRETFAERKARLQAERAAREAASAEVGAGQASDVAEGARTEVPGEAQGAPAGQVASPKGAEEPEPQVASVADLYARGPHRSSRARPGAAEARGGRDAGPEDATPPEPKVATQDGEEEGDEA